MFRSDYDAVIKSGSFKFLNSFSLLDGLTFVSGVKAYTLQSLSIGLLL